MNDLYEFGSACDVIIRCNSDRIIGTQQYKANQPFTILRDVYVNLQYRSTDSEASAKNNILSTRKGLPDVVSITNVTLTDKVCSLISEKTVKPHIITKFCIANVDRGLIYLPETPISDNIYIFYENTPIDNWTRNNDKIGIDFKYDDVDVLIFYEVEAQSASFYFDTPEYGYFTLEILGKGNLDKKSQNIYIKFPAVSLMSVPIFDMVNGSILHAPLQFMCIHQNQDKAYYHIGD